MLSKTRIGLATIAIIVASSLLVLWCSGGTGTPNDVFKDMQLATNRKDYEAVFAHMTPDCQDKILGLLVTMATVRAVADPIAGPQAKKILEENGLQGIDLSKVGMGPNLVSALKQPQRNEIASASPSCPVFYPSAAGLKQSLAEVKNKAACFAQLVEWNESTDESSNVQEPSPAKNPASDPQLVELKVNGDSATGKIKSIVGNNETVFPCSFEKINGAWYIDMSAIFVTPSSPTPN